MPESTPFNEAEVQQEFDQQQKSTPTNKSQVQQTFTWAGRQYPLNGSSSNVISQSTPTNQTQVQAQLQAAKLLNNNSSVQNTIQSVSVNSSQDAQALQQQLMSQLRGSGYNPSRASQVANALINQAIQNSQISGNYYQKANSVYAASTPEEARQDLFNSIYANYGKNIVPSFSLLPKSLRPLFKIIWEIRDTVGGGNLSTRRLNTLQTSLNNQVKAFNLLYGTRALNPTEYSQATAISSQIKSAQASLDSASQIPYSRVLNRISNAISAGPRSYVSRAAGGKLIQFIVPFPITPDIPPQELELNFMGKQANIGVNKFRTDVAVAIGDRDVGVVKGVTFTKGDKGLTLAGGEAGTYKIQGLLNRNKGLVENIVNNKVGFKKGSIRTFTSAEKTLASKESPFADARSYQILKNDLQEYVRDNGLVTLVRDLKERTQVSRGAVITKRINKTLNARSGQMEANEFLSLAKIFSKRDLNIILGKTITSRGLRVRFSGVIKGASKNSGLSISEDGIVTIGKTKLSSAQSRQLRKAMVKVVSTAAASLPKKELLKLSLKSGLKTASSVIPKVVSLKQAIKVRPVMKSVSSVKPRTSFKVKTALGVKIRTAPKLSYLSLSKSRTLQRQTPRLASLSITQQKTIQRQAQRLVQRLRQSPRLKSASKTTGKSIPTFPINPNYFNYLKGISAQKSKKRKSSKKAEIPFAFNVYGKAGGKFIKLNSRPLKIGAALSRGAYVIKNTTSRTFKLKPLGKTRKTGSLRGKEKGYFPRVAYQFRGYKIRKGQKFPIPLKWIEKSRYAISTQGEKEGLSIAKFLAMQRRGGTFRKVRATQGRHHRATPQQLKSLAKARRVLAQRRR